MEFVTFVLCMAIIAQTSAAPLGKNYLQQKFDVPDIARGGFQMTLEATINKRFQEKLKNKSLTVKLAPGHKSKLCDNTNIKGLHICILPRKEELLDNFGELGPITFNLRIKAEINPQDDEELLLTAYLNESYQTGTDMALKFEELKHVSLGGVIGEIRRLHFDFIESA